MLDEQYPWGSLVSLLRSVPQRIGVHAVILVGSHARKLADSISDIDILVITRCQTQFIRCGQWQGRGVEALYISSEQVLDGSRSMFQSAQVLWALDPESIGQLLASATPKPPMVLPYAQWDLRQGLKHLQQAMENHDTPNFRYFLGHWLQGLVKYALECAEANVPTVRRQLTVLETVNRDVASSVARLLEETDLGRAYKEAEDLVTEILDIPQWLPLVDAPLLTIGATNPPFFQIRPLTADDRNRIAEFWREQRGTDHVISRGVVHKADYMIGFAAETDSGEWGGLVTVFAHSKFEWEIVSLDSLYQKSGMGTALLAAVERDAAICGVLRLWLITSNDNLDALRFYQNRGWDWVAVHRDAITEARRLKPEIPALTVDGVAIRHEIEMEKLVGQPASDIESRHSGDSDF